MRNKMGKLISALAVAAIAAQGAASAATGVSFGASAGTDGVGPDALYKINPLLAARGGFRYGDFSVSREIDDIDYDLDIGFTSGVAAFDVHPFANGFRISGGAYFGDRSIDLEARPSEPVEIGDQVFTPDEVGLLTGISEWNSAAPFIGIGFNNGFNALKRFGFQATLGAMYIGAPDVSLEATDGLLSDNPIFLDELAEEEERLSEDLDDIRFYPILNIGFTVRF